MTGTDTATMARPEGRPDVRAARPPEALAPLTSEYFVEWQVADHVPFVPAGSAWEK